MKTHYLLFTALLLGCTTPDTSDDGSTQPTLEGGCPGARLIAMLENAEDSCDLDGAVPEGWVAQQLFGAGSPGVQELDLPVPGDLRRYCSYTPDSSPQTERDYDTIVAAIEQASSAVFTTLAMDCMSQLPQTDLPTDDLHDSLHDAFRQNIDWVAPAELGATGAVRVPVDVAVVDTISADVATDPELTPTNEHGHHMAAIIGDIACPGQDPSCIDSMRFVMALPRADWDTPPDWLFGGEYGTLGDIAVAIYDAVASWKQRRIGDPEGSRRLVLNLSLGWEAWASPTTDLNRGPSAAIEAVLEYASCQGVLVFVAAGNNPTPSCPEDYTGMTLPAMFESFPAPDAARCTELGFDDEHSPDFPVFADEDVFAPLVHGVGGVDGWDAPLINSRVGGQPALVALGSDAAAIDQQHTTLTGTSVSTAVASGAAALLWSYRPELPPAELAQLIYTSGWATGATADTSDASEVRRVSVCASLDAACEGQPAEACPDLGCVATATTSDANLDDFFTEFELALGVATTDTFSSPLSGAAPDCGAGPSNTLAQPQPEVPVCPYCNVDVPPDDEDIGEPDDTVYLAIDSSYVGMITEVELLVYDDARGATTFTFDETIVASLNSSSSGVTTVIIDAPETRSATLLFTLEDTTGVTTQTNPITVNNPN